MLAVLCPGQGGQHEHMLDLLLDDAAAARVLNDVEHTSGAHPRRWAADAERIFDNEVAQPLLCVAQYAAWSSLRTIVPAPIAFAGYSVGELAAYGCAEACTADELLRLAMERARIMHNASEGRNGGMLALRGIDRRRLDGLCAGRDAWVAIVIDDAAFVVGGTLAALAQIQDDLQDTDVKLTCLKVGVASHTPLLAGAVTPFRLVLEQSALRAPSFPVVSGIDGAVRSVRASITDALARQLAETLEWSRCLTALHERGCRVFLELGPGRALTNMVRDRFPDARARSLDDFRSLSGAAAWVRRELS